MKIDIWSDVVCPFCYIGKQKFENALHQFPHKEDVTVTWHSYQLDPHSKPTPGKDINDVLAEKKGVSKEEARQMNDYVTNMAAEVGLQYAMDKVVPANTFNAHRLIHLAKQHGLQQKAEERLFAAYFTEGRNIDNKATLVDLGKDIGLSEEEINNTLDTDQYAGDVTADINKAASLGIRGVPFFVINDKYGISGAQPEETFTNAIQTVWQESQLKPITGDNATGEACTPSGDCGPVNN